ncbi:helix-turn-helix domain-containing protein [Motilimonas eburnea]|uniref:helix-turn-helix domain-containing protein n=1 Tax=Motilimonas eburnea TaxID=1737488 RepID=UPI001E2EE824|nr:AraC family transcriptional regulator [Motilimonas eburnea]MCE2571931.1 AraC family transcriptional regulator [Motilimonas eburnea]
MLSVPLPFIAALLFLLLACLVWVKQGAGVKRIVSFLFLCSATTFVVGLRWSFDIQLIRFIQPVLAATLPVIAWYCFELTQNANAFSLKHAAAPCIILFCSLIYPWWAAPIDVMLVSLLVFYGIKLIVSARLEPQRVRLIDVASVKHLRYIAGGMLLFSALIDAALSLDFAFFNGINTTSILSISYLILLPLLAIAVVMVGSLTTINEPISLEETGVGSNNLEIEQANEIIEQLCHLLAHNQSYLDPDLTLERLARKLSLPSRQLSMAVNQVYQRNVSKVINEYRIKHAQHLLSSTKLSITDIFSSPAFTLNLILTASLAGSLLPLLVLTGNSQLKRLFKEVGYVLKKSSM